MKRPIKSKAKTPQYGLGGFLKESWNKVKDPILGFADMQLSAAGLGNLIQEDDFNNKAFGKAANKFNSAYGKIGETALGIATGGASTKITGAIAGAVGDPQAEAQVKQREKDLIKHNQMLSSYYSNYKPNGMYTPTFKRGGKITKYPEGGPITTTSQINLQKHGYAPNSPIWQDLDQNPEVGGYFTALAGTPDRDTFMRAYNNRYSNKIGGYYELGKDALSFKKEPWVDTQALPAAKPIKQQTTHAGEGLTGISSSPYPKYYAKGGRIQKPNAELEQGEPFRTPDGDINMISEQAPTHEQGGVQMQLPGGTEILGKNIASNGEMFKEIGQRLAKAQARHEKVLKNRPTDIAKRTSKMMLEKVQKEYDSLFAEQEAQKQGMPQGQQFGGGGATYNPAQSQYEQELEYTAGQNTGLRASKFNDLANNIGEYAPIAYNLIQGLKKPNQINAEAYQNPYEQASLGILKNQSYDPSAELSANRNQGMAYTRGVRGLGLSGGQTAANLAAGSINRGRADSAVYDKANKVNAGYAGQYAGALGEFGQRRAQTNMAVEDINTRERAARAGALQAGLSQLSQASQSNKLRNNMILRDAQRMGLLDGLVQNYVLSGDGKWVSRSTGKAATQEEVIKFLKG